MIKINRSLRAWTPLALAVACGALALLWPDWLDELRAQGYLSPPETTITSGPSGTTTQTSVTFTFTGSDDVTPVGSLLYASRLEPLESSFSSFSSSTSRSYSDLTAGDYTFHVKARDGDINTDPTPATQSFTVTATVLVANFTNGNDAAFNSRVYLWNPSTSAGVVTVRVFTLPPIGGLAQELTDTPLNLGTLGATERGPVAFRHRLSTGLALSVLPMT